MPPSARRRIDLRLHALPPAVEVAIERALRGVAEHPGEVIAWAEDGARYEPPSRGWDQTRHSGEQDRGDA